jgi:putative PIN family toxin of toxin-antitoxin system
MLYVVLDTNVFVSAIIAPHSVPAQLLQHWQVGSFRVVTCQRAINELDSVLQRAHLISKYPIIPTKRETLLSLIHERVILVAGDTITGAVTADPKDDMFISCGVEGQVKYIVSGDKHLQQLRRYSTIRVLEPAYFLRILTRCQQQSD